MKLRRVSVGAMVIALVFVACLQATANRVAAEYALTESVVYTEGIGTDGLPVSENTGTFPYTYVGDALNVEVDWSDNIIFHQFSAGSKVRTEVILHDLTIGAAVYTLQGHFMIQALDTSGVPVTPAIYDSYIADGLWVDGPSDAYSAEVNSLGLLLYGYNWDTRGLSAGWYRLTFWIEAETPDNPNAPVIDWGEVNLVQGNAGDTDTSAGSICGFVGYDFPGDKSWVDLYLYPKDHGRK